MRNNPVERSSQLLRSGSLKFLSGLEVCHPRCVIPECYFVIHAWPLVVWQLLPPSLCFCVFHNRQVDKNKIL